MGMPVQEVLDLDAWRPRDNVPDPSGVDATFDAGDTAANTAISYDVDTLLRIRLVIQQTEVTMICSDGNPTEFLIQYENATQATGFIAVGAVGGGSEDCDFVSATGFADDDVTGTLLGSGTPVDGFGMEVAGASPTVTFTDEAVTECELEISIIFNGSQVANGDVINLRVLYSVLDANPPATLVPITNSPSITMIAGAGAFSLDVTPAAISITGSSIDLDLGRTLDVTPVSVVVTGSSIDMTIGYELIVSPAAVVVTGSSVEMTSAFAMEVTPVAVVVTGSSITMDLVVPATSRQYFFQGVGVDDRGSREYFFQGVGVQETFVAAAADDFTLTVTPAAASVAGSSISLDLGRTLDVTPAAVSVTGSSVSLDVGFSLDVTPVAVAVTGSSIDMVSAFAMQVTPASVSITGSSISLDLGRTLDVTPVAVVVTGSSITMDLAAAGNFTLDVTPANIAVSGSSVGLDLGRTLDVSPVTISVTGSSVNLDLGRTLEVAPAAVSVTGSSVAMNRGFSLDVTPAAVAITGSSVTMTSDFALNVTPAVVTVTGSLVGLDLVVGASAAITGTATADINEVDVVAGGKTVVITLTGDTFVAG